jgi:hypothetical protein
MCGSRRFAVLGKYPFRNHFIPRTVCAIIVAAVLKICVGHGVGPRGKRTGGAATLLGKKATGALMTPLIFNCHFTVPSRPGLSRTPLIVPDLAT